MRCDFDRPTTNYTDRVHPSNPSVFLRLASYTQALGDNSRQRSSFRCRRHVDGIIYIDQEKRPYTFRRRINNFSVESAHAPGIYAISSDKLFSAATFVHDLNSITQFPRPPGATYQAYLFRRFYGSDPEASYLYFHFDETGASRTDIGLFGKFLTKLTLILPEDFIWTNFCHWHVL